MLFDPDEDHLCAFCDDVADYRLANSELWACDHHFQLVVAGENDRAQIELLTEHPAMPSNPPVTEKKKKRRRQMIAQLRADILRSEKSGEAADVASFGYEEGILFTRNEVVEILAMLKEKSDAL